MAAKLDLKKEFRQYYRPSAKEPEIIEVPSFNFLQIDGIDSRTESIDFQEAIQALYSVSYKAKFTAKKTLDRDYVVMPLEGLWWADNMDDFIQGRKENWRWTLMIHQPEFITQEIIDASIQAAKKKDPLVSLDKLRLAAFAEGESAQILHIGPYAEEYENIMKIHQLINENDGNFNGQVQKHHEIYLSDFRKTSPEKLKTVIRQGYSKS